MTAVATSPIHGSQDPANPTMPPRIFFVRHGETEWSLSGRYTGRTDIPLTAHGEDAARELGRRIRNLAFTHVLTSPLHRARQTCELAGLATIAEIEPDLTEWDAGDDEGRLPAEILKSRPDWNFFRDGAPHGETPAQVSTRADRFIARLRALDGNIAVFSHGHFGRVLAARWIGLTVREAQGFLLNTASLSVLDYEHGCASAPAIALWNSAARDLFDAKAGHHVGDTRPMKQRAIERWENEGGEIQAAQREQAGGATATHACIDARAGEPNLDDGHSSPTPGN